MSKRLRAVKSAEELDRMKVGIYVAEKEFAAYKALVYKYDDGSGVISTYGAVANITIPRGALIVKPYPNYDDEFCPNRGHFRTDKVRFDGCEFEAQNAPITLMKRNCVLFDQKVNILTRSNFNEKGRIYRPKGGLNVDVYKKYTYGSKCFTDYESAYTYAKNKAHSHRLIC